MTLTAYAAHYILCITQVPGMASSSTRSQQLDEPASPSHKGGWKYTVGDSDVSLPFIHAVQCCILGSFVSIYF